MTFNNSIYAGMGNGYILTNPSIQDVQSETALVVELTNYTTAVLLILMFAVIIAVQREKV